MNWLRKISVAINVIGIVILLAGTVFLGLANSVNAQSEMITICHAAGQVGTLTFVTLTLPYPAVYGVGGHFNESGTSQAGHENDYLGACQNQTEPTPTATATVFVEPTLTTTSTSTPRPTFTPTNTHTPEPSFTPTNTHTPEPSFTPTNTHTPGPSYTPTNTHTPEPTSEGTLEPTITSTPESTEEGTPEPTVFTTPDLNKSRDKDLEEDEGANSKVLEAPEESEEEVVSVSGAEVLPVTGTDLAAFSRATRYLEISNFLFAFGFAVLGLGIITLGISKK